MKCYKTYLLNEKHWLKYVTTARTNGSYRIISTAVCFFQTDQFKARTLEKYDLIWSFSIVKVKYTFTTNTLQTRLRSILPSDKRNMYTEKVEVFFFLKQTVHRETDRNTRSNYNRADKREHKIFLATYKRVKF